ncbi:LysR family transcriptional regulator [Streptomyces sp. NPDC059176]|uniref:helix-turn-helix domain-containing protein n=1 Tax=unclassified Streptomyces TaxID=2593676 RepID=UPI00367FFB59
MTGAAARLPLSAPAMSRTLGRMRARLGNPVLVRAGRRMVPNTGRRATASAYKGRCRAGPRPLGSQPPARWPIPQT